MNKNFQDRFIKLWEKYFGKVNPAILIMTASVVAAANATWASSKTYDHSSSISFPAVFPENWKVSAIKSRRNW